MNDWEFGESQSRLAHNPLEDGIGTRNTRPQPSIRPLIESLRFNHFRHNGRFGVEAKRNLIQDLFRCISGYEDLWVDPNDPKMGKACFKSYDFHRVSLRYEDEIGVIPIPFSVRELQNNQEQAKRLREGPDAPPIERVRYGRQCGKIIQRMESFYNCKTCFRDVTSLLCVDCFQHSDHEGHDVTFRNNYNFAPICHCGCLDLYKDPTLHSCRNHPRHTDPLRIDDETTRFSPGTSDSPEVTVKFQRALYDCFVACIEYIIDTFGCAPPAEHYSRLPKDLKEMTTSWNINCTSVTDAEKRAAGPWSIAIFPDERHNEPEIIRQMEHATGCDFQDCADWARELEVVGRKVVMTVSNPSVAFHLANMFQQIDVPVSLRHAYDTYQESAAATIIEWLADICACHVAGDPDLTTKIMSQVLREDRSPKSGGPKVAPDFRRLLRASRNESRPDQPRSRIRLDWMWHIDNRLWKLPKLCMKAIYAKMMTVHPTNMDFMVDRFAAHYITFTQDYLHADRDSDSTIYQFLSYSICSNGKAVAEASERRSLLINMVEVLEVWYRHLTGDYRDRIPTSPAGPLDGSRREHNLRMIGHKNKKGLLLLSHLRVVLMLDAVADHVASSLDLFTRMNQFTDNFIGMQPQRHETEEHLVFEVDWTRSFQFMADLAKVLRQLGECYLRAEPEVTMSGIVALAERILNDLQMLTDVYDPARYNAPIFRPVPSMYDDTKYHKGSWTLIQCQLNDIEAFSFHHYNHWLMAQMIQSYITTVVNRDGHLDLRLTLFNDIALKTAGRPITNRNELEARRQEMLFMMMEQPLSKYIVARHIRANRWSRNGGAISGQLSAYVDPSRRDVTSDQEFYLLQAFLCLLGPVPFALAAMDRFGVVEDTPINAQYMAQFEDPIGTVTDHEDFLWFLIFLLTDNERVLDTDIMSLAGQTMIQLLAVKPMTYSELVKGLSDRINERVEIVKVLHLVADYRGPTETAPGEYTLKAQWISHINPFWRHYHRNERKEVLDKLLKKTFETRPDRSIGRDKWFYIPQKLTLPAEGMPFHNLGEILGSSMAIFILQIVLEHCVLMENDRQFLEAGISPENIPRFDQLLDVALHFATLALVHVPERFIPRALSIPPGSTKGLVKDATTFPTRFSRDQCLYQNLWYMELSHTGAYAQFIPRISYLTEELQKHIQGGVKVTHKAPIATEKTTQVQPVSSEKISGAARQKQLMAEFAKKQAAFAAVMDFSDNDDDDMQDEDDDKEPEHQPCIVCQEAITPIRPGGLLAMFQPSRMIRETPAADVEYFAKSLRTPVDLDNATRKLAYANLRNKEYRAQRLDAHPVQLARLGCYVSVCSHYMHESCMDHYSESTRNRHGHQMYRNQPDNIVRHEFICPLCKNCANFVLPIDFEATPVGGSHIPRRENGSHLNLLEYIRIVSADGLKYINDSTKIWQHHDDAGHIKAWFSDAISPRANKEKRDSDLRGMTNMVDRFRHLCRALADSSHELRGSKKPFYAPEDALGYTVAVLEIAQRSQPRSPGQETVAEQILDMSRMVIKKMLEELKLELVGFFGKDNNFAELRVAIFARFLPDWFRASSLPTSLLSRDPFSIVIECAAIAPHLLLPVITMAYYAEVIRVLIYASIAGKKLVPGAMQLDPTLSDPFEGPFAEQAKARFSGFLYTAITLFRNSTPYNDVDTTLRSMPDATLSKLLYMHTLPFVRRAAMVYYAVHGCYPIPSPAPEGCEYDRLAYLMALPNPKETLSDPSNSIELSMVLRWLTQWANSGRQTTPLETCGPYELLSLPKRYEELVLRYGSEEEVCARCGRSPQWPVLCLSCGELLCLGADCCADDNVGECNRHVRICGAVTGLFADVKRCTLVALYAGTGSFFNMPYLDEHGDFDGGGQKRGHRLILNEQRYEEIRRNIWLNHAIPSIIGRKMENGVDGGGWSSL